MFAQVCIDRRGGALVTSLTYEIPEPFASQTRVGSYVLVPLQKQEATGFVVGITHSAPNVKTKRILSVLNSEPLFDEQSLQLARWMSSYYHCPLADALSCVAPPGGTQIVKRKLVWSGPGLSETLIARDLSPAQENLARFFFEQGGEVALERLGQQDMNGTDGALRWLKRHDFVRDEWEVRAPAAKPKTVLAVEVASPPPDKRIRNAKQQSLYDIIAQCAGPVAVIELLKSARVARSTLNGLERSGHVQFVTIEQRRTIAISAESNGGGGVLSLSREQTNALDRILTAIAQKAFQTILLHGVTASGKTEVYLRAIETSLDLGRNAIVLVPEIALTAQAMDLFLTRFPGQVAILHSGLSAGERYDEWMRLKRGDARIALGARSAIFAPLRHVGLIIVDEEHEGSYKQESSPRYHARDVALTRARSEDATVVLASATPSLESMFHMRRGAYSLVELRDRVQSRPMPTIEIVDLRLEGGDESEGGEPTALGPRLREAIVQHVERDEQVMLFLNRRGFSAVLFCPSCGVYERCPNCSVSLTFHQNVRRLRCHHCNFVRLPKDQCPKCKGPLMGYGGPGTEKVEEEVRALLPGIETMRMDRDTTTRKGTHSKLLHHFRSRKASVLVGTQMIAKGLDFPGVTLVGVVNADVGLHLPDWRAAERTFQILMQVSGRAGRGEIPGHVIVQTYLPHNYAVAHAVAGRFSTFVEEELRFRNELLYPPFTFAANVVITGRSNKTAEQRAERVAQSFRDAASNSDADDAVMGPAPCPIVKLRGTFRWHLFVRHQSRPKLHRILDDAINSLSPAERASMIVDVDPMSVL